ncbi:cob(I)yrinic acid a,c-diamide adenosyltransferase [Candidatus Woesearchaeota archaeon]|nr:cob(I)yrinic acid a,c-diamide adenosyltransferase [Candidatus Woesearchaeota archaeon]
MSRLQVGEVHLVTGNGSGKSTSAFGVALRALGHGKKVIVIQFMKGRQHVGEYKIQHLLKNYNVIQCGRRGWVNLNEPSEKDKALARRGLHEAYRALAQKPFLLILDEVNLACAIGLLNVYEVLTFLDAVPKATYVYITGRHAPKELRARADFVTFVENKKYPSTMKARAGIEY